MKRTALAFTLLLVLFSLFLTPAGTVDAASSTDGFDPGAGGPVNALVVQPDGKILVGGIFTSLGGQTRSNIGRLNADGSLDILFNPEADNTVAVLAVQADGKILVGGSFTSLGGQPRSRIGRLNADGSLDNSFNPGANGAVNALAVQADGKILVGGGFTSLGGQPRDRIGRLNADGSLDIPFNPEASSTVYALAVQADGKIVVGGGFTSLGGQTRSRIGRLNADGSLDTPFNPGASSTVYALAVQADGKIVAGGWFTTLGGQARSYIGRLNADGSLDIPFNPEAGGTVSALAVQADGKILAGGSFISLGGQARSGIGRLNADGSLDIPFNPGADGTASVLAVQPDGKIVVGGDFTSLGGQPRSRIGRLNVDGSLDATFNPVANDTVNALAVQADGKILVGGWFATLGGQPRSRIGRLNADGSLDAAFNPGANSVVNALAVQADGKILVGGNFNSLGGSGSTRNYIGRLNTDGSLDVTFDPGASNTVFALAVQADGKILVGGNFTTLGGATRNYIGRLNADGSPDATFDPGASSTVYALAVQADGKIVVGGVFTTLGGQPRSRIGRLNADGSLDATFDPGASSTVYALALQADGKILVGGSFTSLGGQPRSRIGRLNADGSLDAIFNSEASGSVYTLAVQVDGKIVVGGNFTTLGGATRNYLGRLNADGSLDIPFDPGANNAIYALAVQADGKILAGGDFTTLGGAARSFIGRLSADTPALQALAVDPGGTTVTWSRTGSGPEVSRVTFEQSTDGSAYTPLGAGARVTGGWRLSGMSLPYAQNLFIRARGYFATGYHNGSSSVVESVRNIFLSNSAQTGPIYTVNTVADDDDGQCTMNHCTLREAINAANTHLNGSMPDEIFFNIPLGCSDMSGVCTITPGAALPAISEAVVIDGYSQPGAITKPLIELNGVNTPAGTDGLSIQASGSTVRGLMIDRFKQHGISITGSASTGNRILGNAIFDNTGMGIDLNGDGITPNDAGDGDSGANGLQNFPVLTSLSGSTLGGKLNSSAGTTFRVEFFASAACDPSHYGEGEQSLGALNVTTDAGGNASFAFTFTPLDGMSTYIATATSATTNDSSEFSPCLPYAATTTVLSVSPDASSFNYGDSMTFTASVTTGIAENPYPTGQVQFYDGDVPLGNPLNLDSSGKAEYATSKLPAGNHTLAAQFLANDAYPGSRGSLSLSVSPKTLTVSGITAGNKTYDGATSAPLDTSTAALVGVVANDSVTLVKDSAAGAFADKNAGLNKAVTISGLSITGADAGSYTLTQPTATASITLRPLTITAGDQDKVYGEALPTLTVFYSGFAAGDSPSVLTSLPEVTTTATALSPVGAYPITFTSSLPGALNYSFTLVEGTLTIRQAATTLQLSTSTDPSDADLVTLTAVVSAVPPGSGLPTGLVVFKKGDTVLGSAALVPNDAGGATASFSITLVTEGRHSITATFSGDTNFTGSSNTIEVRSLIFLPIIIK